MMVEARPGEAWQGMARQGLARHGKAWLGMAGLGKARLGWAGHGMARHGMARFNNTKIKMTIIDKEKGQHTSCLVFTPLYYNCTNLIYMHKPFLNTPFSSKSAGDFLNFVATLNDILYGTDNIFTPADDFLWRAG